MSSKGPNRASEQALRARIRELEAERESLLAALEHAPAPVALTAGPEHAFTFANRALREHLGVQDLVGRPLRAALPNWADHPLHELLDCALGNGELARAVDVATPAAPGARPLDFTLAPLRDAEGDVVGVATFGGAQAAAAPRTVDPVLEVVSHELRSPIHVVMGYLALLRADTAHRLTPADRALLGKLAGAADALARIVDDLLDLSAVQAGTLTLRPQLLDFGEVVDAAMAIHAPRAATKDLRLVADMPPDLPAVVADERRMIQTVEKLLDNAVKFTPAGGRVAVRVSAEAGRLRCEIADSGPGIAAADLPRIFEPFFKLDPSLTREAAGLGTGLGTGLALSRAFAEAHGGTLAARSTPGRGATFRVEVPLAGRAGL